jgi:hypothetical protein
MDVCFNLRLLFAAFRTKTTVKYTFKMAEIRVTKQMETEGRKVSFHVSSFNITWACACSVHVSDVAKSGSCVFLSTLLI